MEFCFGEFSCEGCSRVNDQTYGCVNFLCSVQSCKLVQIVINLFCSFKAFNEAYGSIAGHCVNLFL